MKELPEFCQELVVAVFVATELVAYFLGGDFDLFQPVERVAVPEVAVDHVMAGDLDVDILEAEVIEVGVELPSRVRVEIGLFFKSAHYFPDGPFHAG